MREGWLTTSGSAGARPKRGARGRGAEPPRWRRFGEVWPDPCRLRGRGPRPALAFPPALQTSALHAAFHFLSPASQAILDLKMPLHKRRLRILAQLFVVLMEENIFNAFFFF